MILLCFAIHTVYIVARPSSAVRNDTIAIRRYQPQDGASVEKKRKTDVKPPLTDPSSSSSSSHETLNYRCYRAKRQKVFSPPRFPRHPVRSLRRWWWWSAGRPDRPSHTTSSGDGDREIVPRGRK